MRYLLELKNAVKIDTGVYRWNFSLRNQVRPRSMTVGPCSITADTDIRNAVLLSNTFRESDLPFVNRNDTRHPVHSEGRLRNQSLACLVARVDHRLLGHPRDAEVATSRVSPKWKHN